MKIEICDNTFWLFFWFVIAIALTTVGVVAIRTDLRVKEAAFAAGYELGSIPGVSESKWVKPRSTMNLERKQ